MAFIDTVVSEKNFETELVAKLGWISVTRFMRVAYTRDTNPMTCGVLHHIFKSPNGDLFGIARATDVYSATSGIQAVFSDAYERFYRDRRLQNFYLYTLEKFDESFTRNHSVVVNSSPLRNALDVENISGAKDLDVFQSPMIPIIMRKRENEEVFFENMVYTNWWEDSLIRVRGYVDNKMAFITVQSDNAPRWEDNLVPRIPLFLGRFQSFSAEAKGNLAIFGGSQGRFDPDDYSNRTPLPIAQTYKSHPGNGISDVIVRRTKYGARYQAHYLAWNTTPNAMEPTLEGYPRSWNTPPGYMFNPSAYANEVFSSEVYIVHPEHGYYGFIPNIILTNQLSILDGDILEVETSTCQVFNGTEWEGDFDEYIYTEIDAPSPLTIPGRSIHRSAGIGIKS